MQCSSCYCSGCEGQQGQAFLMRNVSLNVINMGLCLAIFWWLPPLTCLGCFLFSFGNMLELCTADWGLGAHRRLCQQLSGNPITEFHKLYHVSNPFIKLSGEKRYECPSDAECMKECQWYLHAHSALTGWTASSQEPALNSGSISNPSMFRTAKHVSQIPSIATKNRVCLWDTE